MQDDQAALGPAPVVLAAPRSRIRIRTLMMVTAGVAISLAAWPRTDLLAVGLFASGLIPSLVAPRARNTPMGSAVFACILGVITVSELVAGAVAHETIGEVVAGVYLLATFLNVVFAIAFGLRFRVQAYFWMILVALILIPPQITLGLYYRRLNAESAAIIAHAQGHKARNGAYPADLTGYASRHPELMPEMDYASTGAEFTLRFHVGSPNTSHDYSSKTGWFYYLD